jgi:hypothetical protein
VNWKVSPNYGKGRVLTEEEGLVVPKQKERESGEMEEQLLEEIQNNPDQ